jgi:TRAP-type C4-dicarboxylate transport system permease small subunit
MFEALELFIMNYIHIYFIGMLVWAFLLGLIVGNVDTVIFLRSIVIWPLELALFLGMGVKGIINFVFK